MDRSEDIDLYKLTLNKDICLKVMNELGRLKQLHFLDLNRDVEPFKLPYIKNIKNADESLRQIE